MKSKTTSYCDRTITGKGSATDLAHAFAIQAMHALLLRDDLRVDCPSARKHIARLAVAMAGEMVDALDLPVPRMFDDRVRKFDL